MAFEKQHLSLAQDELDEIQDGLENLGTPDALASVCTEDEKMVRDWTNRYVVPEETLKRLWRAIAIFHIYSLLEQVPKNREQAYKVAMEELTAIRDGKFDYPAAASAPETRVKAAWGSRTKLGGRLE